MIAMIPVGRSLPHVVTVQHPSLPPELEWLPWAIVAILMVQLILAIGVFSLLRRRNQKG